MKSQILSLSLLLIGPTLLSARAENFAQANDVAWNSLGTNENSSMPIGNGDIALNVWTETNGDIVLLLAKSDAWSENGQLLKLGRVRVKLTPNPFASAASFTQTLRLESGDMKLPSGQNTVHIWADANRPVVHLEVQTEQPVEVAATSEMWRTKTYHLNQRAVSADGFFEFGTDRDGLNFEADTILPAHNNQVSWCHFDSNSIYPMVFEKEHLASLLPKYPDPILHRCFGVTLKGEGLVSADNQTLKSAAASRSCRLDLYALTRQTETPEAWQTALSHEIEAVDAVKLETAWAAHQQWWTDFWNRSWIHITGTTQGAKVSQSYIMQRYLMACAGRGAQPVKFNGGLFTVGHDLPEGVTSSERNWDPDYRTWGACFWNQNTRCLYWPLIATGDNDLMAPWFNMYVQALPLLKDRTRQYFHHDGAACLETMYFWGLPNINDFGWDNPGVDLQSAWMRYHIQGGLEVLAQMLDYYDYTQDADFARHSLLPLADAVVTFYDQHWSRGPDGKILFSPSQSIETYQLTAVNPTPDIAGLLSTLPRLLALPTDFLTQAQRDAWTKELKDLPPIPLGTTAKNQRGENKLPPRGQGETNGMATILPAQKYDGTKNGENPELYSVFPYSLYGVGKPNLELARNAYQARLFRMSHCWGQDGFDAATLGLTDEAKRVVRTS
jgi:alpha-L-fucosidase 2